MVCFSVVEILESDEKNKIPSNTRLDFLFSVLKTAPHGRCYETVATPVDGIFTPACPSNQRFKTGHSV